jgi:hypothetical protein
MVTYSYLREYDDLARAVIMDVVIPRGRPLGQGPAQPVHLAFRDALDPRTAGDPRAGPPTSYFDYFYDILSVDGRKITADARSVYVNGYATDSALAAGFDWYRAFSADAVERMCGAARTRRSRHRCSTCAASMSAATSPRTCGVSAQRES